MADSPLETTTLHALLDRMRAGDAAASDELLHRVGGRLERLARRMRRNFPAVQAWVQTDDVVQDALMRLLRALRAVRPGSTREFFGLAAEQIRRELLDLARRLRARGGPAESADAHDPPDAAPADDDLERWRRFHDEVARLPEDERETVGLIFYHGLKQAEAAALLGVTDRTIRRRWESALLRLRQVLREEPPE